MVTSVALGFCGGELLERQLVSSLKFILKTCFFNQLCVQFDVEPEKSFSGAKFLTVLAQLKISMTGVIELKKVCRNSNQVCPLSSNRGSWMALAAWAKCAIHSSWQMELTWQ